MNIELKELLALVAEAVDAGVQSYIKSIEPASDYVKQREAKRYIARLGYKPAMLQRWVNERLLTPVKTGDSHSSPVIYSLAEIKTLISSLRLKSSINKTKHDYV